MPARLLREGILDSEAVCSLTFQAEVFYRRLMSVVDDFGRYDGRPGVLRSRLYPLQIDKVREADITRWIAECEKAGLIALYSVSGKQYILFRKLGSARAKESKWPAPPDGFEARHASENICAQMRADENGCVQVLSDVPGSGTGSGTGSDAGAGSKKSGVPPPVVVLTFPTDGDPREWALCESHLAEWAALYPTLDILAECRKALAWVTAAADRRKTAAGMRRFLTGWLNRATERGGVRKPAGPPPPTAPPAADFWERKKAEAAKGGTP
jgi:hypothetical protein